MMPDRPLLPQSPPSPAAELLIVVLLSLGALVSVPLALGGIGLGWDALNHHVYLGWVADSARFDRDHLAASNQSFQFPYLYWPLYKLMQHGFSGQMAGAVLAALNVLAVPALWVLTRTCIPERTWYGLAMRSLGVALAFASGVVLSHLDSTANDLLAGIPLLWAIALAVLPYDRQRNPWLGERRCAVLSGAAAGVAVACKLSNGPLAAVLPLLWALHGPGVRARLGHVLGGSVALVAAFAMTYGYWGWQLWLHYANPVYPFYDHIFSALARWLGHQP
jgi:hypothetical protein